MIIFYANISYFFNSYEKIWGRVFAGLPAYSKIPFLDM
jgi:hypothetical protein